MLREGVAQGRLSHDTFIRRMGLVFAARGHSELDALIADLGQESPVVQWLARIVGAASSLNLRMRRAWWSETLPKLMLPEPGLYPLRIGRDYGSGLRLSDESVSRAHAVLRHDGAVWKLRDLGSTNGTWVNGGRITGESTVHPGDLVVFGRVAFRLAGR